MACWQVTMVEVTPPRRSCRSSGGPTTFGRRAPVLSRWIC